MAFEDNVLILRKKKFPSQEALAKEMGVKKQAVSNWKTARASSARRIFTN